MRAEGRYLVATIGIVGLGLLLVGCPGSPMYERMKRQEAEEEFRRNPPKSLYIYYIGTSGEVGHHMFAEPRARCGATWNSNSPTMVGGSLPDGLRLRGSRIEGTPQSPGRWQATLRYTGINCRGKSYPDQDVRVDFTIKGFAPKRVD